ncbi:VOC family protein [Arthrobacter sp. ISL-28]|uniref:VOC family protein n=1 Tax=Arthrobacter sp. ISL-28 TaxID=2819108 RepID=UPI001BEB4674|nr:VOC family protein [Arthrobacter sp. ISL-28]MBT2520160.1 VOC family protein [Arthrobacter sp. ISL-28]
MNNAPHGARFGHVNVIAADWRRLADFYQRVFGCEVVPPERDQGGPDLERGTAVHGAALRGVHMRLPGTGDTGPTLEIYTYRENVEGGTPTANRTGWGHIAFMVDDVDAARESVRKNGGASVGDIVTFQTSDGRQVTWCYVSDPEGNFIELQNWSTRS